MTRLLPWAILLLPVRTLCEWHVQLFLKWLGDECENAVRFNGIPLEYGYFSLSRVYLFLSMKEAPNIIKFFLLKTRKESARHQLYNPGVIPHKWP